MRPLARLGAVQRSQGENPQQGIQRLPGAAQRLVEMGELGQRLDEAHQQHQHGHQSRAVQPLSLHRPGAAEQGEGERRLHRQGEAEAAGQAAPQQFQGAAVETAQGLFQPLAGDAFALRRAQQWLAFGERLQLPCGVALGGQPGILRRQIAPPAPAQQRGEDGTSKEQAEGDGRVDQEQPEDHPERRHQRGDQRPQQVRRNAHRLHHRAAQQAFGRRDPAQRRQRQARQARHQAAHQSSRQRAAGGETATQGQVLQQRLRQAQAEQRGDPAPGQRAFGEPGLDQRHQQYAASGVQQRRQDRPGARPTQRGTAVFGQRTHSFEQGHAATSAPFCSRHKRA